MGDAGGLHDRDAVGRDHRLGLVVGDVDHRDAGRRGRAGSRSASPRAGWRRGWRAARRAAASPAPPRPPGPGRRAAAGRRRASWDALGEVGQARRPGRAAPGLRSRCGRASARASRRRRSRTPSCAATPRSAGRSATCAASRAAPPPSATTRRARRPRSVLCVRLEKPASSCSVVVLRSRRGRPAPITCRRRSPGRCRPRRGALLRSPSRGPRDVDSCHQVLRESMKSRAQEAVGGRHRHSDDHQ